MDDQNQQPLNVDDLDAALAAALGQEPSAGFRSRVRERVAQESIAPGWVSSALPVAVAAGVATLALVGALTRDRQEPAMMPAPGAAADVTLAAVPQTPPSTPPVAARPEPQRKQPTRRVGTASLPGPSAAPVEGTRTEVLLSDSERAGVRLLFEAAASGRLELPPEMLQDLSIPLARHEGATEGDNQ